MYSNADYHSNKLTHYGILTRLKLDRYLLRFNLKLERVKNLVESP